MSNGCDQMKWLLGKKGSNSRRWKIDDYPVLVPRSKVPSHEVKREMDDFETSTGTSDAISKDNQTINGHVARTITIRDV